MNYKSLNKQIKSIHTNLYQQAVKAVNTHLTIRNWLIGFYIVEFEQNGKDRAKYGTELLQKLAKDLVIKGLTRPDLSRCRQFYLVYPQILGSVTQEFKNFLPVSIRGSATHKFKNTLSLIPIRGSLTHKLEIRPNIDVPENYYQEFLTKISFTHIAELIKIKNNTKRMFYEMMILKNSLSVCELEKQIATLAYERTGFSKKPAKAFVEIQKKISPAQIDDVVKSMIKEKENSWFAKTDLGNLKVEFLPKNDFGIIDHLVTLPNGIEVNNPMRVIANGQGSELIFTLFWTPDRTEEEFNQDAKAVMNDLQKVKKILETK